MARWQAEEVTRLLLVAHPGLEVRLVIVDTLGDRRTDRQVWELGGQGVFVKEVQAAVLSGEADVAVHSAKDLPSASAPGLALVAFPARADPRDAMVGRRVSDLAPGATVATGSVRRRAQLGRLRPDLVFIGLRGNIATRLDRIPPDGSVLMAMAALDRLGLGERVAETFEPDVMLPQVGQGAIAIECRADDDATRQLLEVIDHDPTAVAVRAERAFLAALGGGCDLPVGAYATIAPMLNQHRVAADAVVTIDAMVASTDGDTVLRARRSGPVSGAVSMGHEVASALMDGGGRALLEGGRAETGPGAVLDE